MLAAIDQCNQDPGKADNQVMISLDVVALYPSLEAEETSEICASMVVSSGLWFDAIDWEEAALYAVLTDGSDCVSSYCLPSRKFAAGPKPTITTAEVMGPLHRKMDKSKFDPPAREATLQEKKAILHHLLKTVDDGNFKLSAIEEGLIWNNDTNALIKDPSSTVSLASPGGCSEWYNSVF